MKVEMQKKGDTSVNLPFGDVVDIKEHAPLEIFNEFVAYVGASVQP